MCSYRPPTHRRGALTFIDDPFSFSQNFGQTRQFGPSGRYRVNINSEFYIFIINSFLLTLTFRIFLVFRFYERQFDSHQPTRVNTQGMDFRNRRVEYQPQGRGGRQHSACGWGEWAKKKNNNNKGRRIIIIIWAVTLHILLFKHIDFSTHREPVALYIICSNASIFFLPLDKIDILCLVYLNRNLNKLSTKYK